MGLSLFGNSPGNYEPPNPCPFNFEVRKILCTKGEYQLLLVKYFGCTNFDGLKIVLVKGQFNPKYLDPHFLKGNNVIARFRPDKDGTKLAKVCMEIIDG